MRIPPVLILLTVFFFSYLVIAAQSNLHSHVELQQGEQILDSSWTYVDDLEPQLNLSKYSQGKYIANSNKRSNKLYKRLQWTNNKYLRLFMKEEDAVLHKLCKVDIPDYEIGNALSVNIGIAEGKKPNKRVSKNTNKIKPDSERQAEALMNDALYEFRRFENICERSGNEAPNKQLAELDTISATTDYINLFGSNPSGQVTNKKGQSSSFRTSRLLLLKELKRTELIQQYINERQAYLNSVLSDIPGCKALLLPIRKCNYYYNAQIKEYKRIFSTRSFLDKMVTEQAKRIPGFETLIKQYQPIDKDILNANKSGIENIKLEQLLSSIKNETQSSQQFNTDLLNDAKERGLGSIDGAESKLGGQSSSLNQVSESLNTPKLSTGNLNKSYGKDADNWKPNPLKTKRLSDRLIYGGNIQIDAKNRFFPSSLNCAGNIVFQYSRNGNIGIGGSIVYGLYGSLFRSENMERINMSTNGWAIRSSIDYRIRGSIYVLGGYEQNYRDKKILSANHSNELALNKEMLPSLIIGFKIRYPVKNKRSTPTTEIAYDFMHRHTGQSAIVFRTGIEFNSKNAFKNKRFN